MHPDFLTSLPQDWKLLPMNKACRFTSKPRGLSLDDYPTMAFVPMDLIPSDRLTFSDYILKPPAAIASGTYFEEGDLLISKITPCFENGKQGIAKTVPNGFGIATTEVIPIREVAGVAHLPFIAYYFLEHEVRALLACAMEGATGRQRLPRDLLAEWPVPIPPIAEQRAISDLLSGIQTALAAEKERYQCLATLKAGTLEKLFRQGLRGEPLKDSAIGLIPESWELVTLGRDNRCRMKSGGTPSRSIREYWGGGIPWVKTTEIDYRDIAETEETITELGLLNSSAKVFEKGTLLMAMYGQGVTRGRVAMLGIHAATNQACAAFFPDESILPAYLYAYFTHSYQALRDLGHGANQRNLSLELLQTVKIPVPDREEQGDIAKIIETLQRRLETSEERCNSLNRLFDTLLHSLMTGSLRIRANENAEVNHG